VADTVKAALQQMPHNQVRIHLHPDDLALVRAHLADALEHGHHRLIEDDSMTRGGCRLDGAGSEIDATVETRWRRILEGLGCTDTAWPEHD
jgi:flagellar assembly protein FliH